MNKTHQYGITGGIGTGKSFVCNVFKHLNIPIYDADSRAKYLMAADEKVKNQIVETFGNQSYEGGELNRKYLASKVFNDSDEVSKLNAIVHPAVGRDYQEWVDDNNDSPYLLKEAALMFESGSYKFLDGVIYVNASRDVRIERIKKRDPHRSEEEIKSIMNKQLSEKELKDRSDYIIHNDGEQMLLPQIIDLHQRLLKR